MIRYVYLLKAKPNYLKVGISSRPHIRRAQVCNGSNDYPSDSGSPRLVAFTPGTVAHEIRLHCLLSEFRVDGHNEWYYDSPEARAVAKRYLDNPTLPEPVFLPSKPAAPMNCPHCNQPLTPEQITKLWAQLSASKRKVKSGGKNGGRPRKPQPPQPDPAT